MENNKKQMTPMLKQYTEIKKQHKDKILFFRMGDFYEMFFDDAVIASKILNIALTSRHKENNIPMCGIPYHALSNYTQKLLEQGHKIAICEQVEDPKNAKKIVKREVVKILTPAVNSEIDNLFSDENYFLFAYYKQNLAIVDFSNGDFFYEKNINIHNLISEIEKHFPKEIIISENDLNLLKKETYLDFYNISVNIINNKLLETHNEVIAKWQGNINLDVITIILNYIIENNKFIPEHLKKPEQINLKKYLVLDENTLSHLELLKNVNGKTEGTLFSLLNNCKTSMGARKLKTWISYPLTDETELSDRYNFIEELIESPHLKKDLTGILSKIGDLERLNSKIALKNILPQELINLKNYLEEIPNLKKTLSEFKNRLALSLNEKLQSLPDIISTIEKHILPEPSNNINDGDYINKGVNKELDRIRDLVLNSKKWLLNYEAEIKEKYDISNLKIKYNKVFGYFIEITKKNLDKIPENFIRKQTLVNAERFITPELKEFEEQILSSDEKLQKLQKEIYTNLLNSLSEKCANLKFASDIISAIDIINGFSDISLKYGYSKPSINDNYEIEIANGRHPILDEIMKDNFIPNDLKMNKKNKIFIITGPNMAGKSTYMRQNALLIIMAQIGCFVPATKMNYFIFDRIFTRIGAKDKILEGESTFMVEMNETSKILNNLTDKSFVILDELGRGTSTYDGMSIAWSILEYLSTCDKNFLVLFATHYHELTTLESMLPNIKNYSVNVKELDDRLLFLRQIKRGPSDRSYGIEVASLAKLPETVITRAKEILHKLENREQPKIKRKIKQKTIFDNLKEKKLETIAVKLKELDLNHTTPIEALNFLYKLKDKVDSISDL